MNKVILMGRLTRDCEVRYSQGAEPVAVNRFSVAVNRKFKKEGEPDADFFNCIAFGKQGEVISQYFKKGNLINIVGELRNNNWTDKDGKKHYDIQVNVTEFDFCGEKNEKSETTSAPVEQEQAYKVAAVNDDDLPF